METVTILLIISRDDYLLLLLHSIEVLECNSSKTNIIAIVDGDDSLFVKVRNLIEETKFNERLCVKYNSEEKFSKFNVNVRRKRIADIHNQVKKYIGECTFIFCIEDDTIIPEYTLKFLLRDYSKHPQAGFIEAVELGRWGIYYVGAWKVDDIYNINQIKSLTIPDDLVDVQEIDSGGFYCFLTRKETYINHNFKTFENGALGPDVDFGVSLRQQGYVNYINWNINCIHKSENGNVYIPKDTPSIVQFNKVDNIWTYKIL